MKSISKAMRLSLLAGMLLAGCTTETVQKGGGGDNPQPGGDGNEQRREVQFSLNNELVLHKATNQPTRADETIATVEENAITSLDVYVFGSATEQGDYTFQERFAYRADDAAALPAGATLLDLQAVAGSKNQTQGMLKLKKGLFVKLYCIANSPTLINPVSQKTVDESDFIGLSFSDPGTTGTGVATEGTPTESEFLTFHTPLLEADKGTDILLTPLAMSGSYTTPIDLTDFESSTRMQLSVKLTRLAARFDVVNNAKDSRFTIKEIALGNGRRGATYFPIRIYGETPTANPDELITYPVRKFDGEKANIDKQTGAFYSYPSPLEDKGFLILKGIYQVNQTEEKEVSYQIPFTQYQDDGSATAIAINNNHRYTIGITKADDYHLDFTLEVADWTDSGKIDDYTPDTENGAISISIPVNDAHTRYDADSHTVAMSLDLGTTFDATMDKMSGVRPILTKTYTGGLSAQQYDWLDVAEPLVLTSASLAKATEGDAVVDGFKYTFSLKTDYTKNYYPRAIIRFTNPTNGRETVLFVDALAAPVAVSTTQAGSNNHNIFDSNALKANVYRLAGSNLRIKLLCPAGIQLGDCPIWLTSQKLSENNGESLYSFTLNEKDVTPSDNKGTIIFKNAKYLDKILEITVNLLVADITPNFNDLGGDSNNSYTPALGSMPANVSMRIAEGNTFKFTSTSLDGFQIDMNFDGGPAWLSHNGEVVPSRSGSVVNNITFSLVKDKLQGAKTTTITLKNKTIGGGKDYVFTVTPDFVAPTLSSNVTMTLEAKTDKAIPSIQITGNCFGGSTIVANASPDWLTYDATSTMGNSFSYNVSLMPGDEKANFPTSLPDPQTITLASTLNPDKKTTVTVNFTDKGWVEESINEDEAYTNNGSDPKKEYRVATVGKKLTLTVYSMFAIPTVETAYDSHYGTNTSWLPKPMTPSTSGYDSNRKKFTFQIAVPASSGTDAAYQLHKGTITIKQGTTLVKELTIWRGASKYPYPTGRSENAYYSAVNVGGTWWAPFNQGASEIAKNATEISSIGYLYQWGRKVETTYGSSSKTSGPISNNKATDEFITSSSGDWLTPQSNYLWGNEGKNKTDLDPCPIGWRVPTSSEINMLSTGSSSFANSLFSIIGINGLNLVLPTAGSRDPNGYSGGRPSNGYYWSSTVNGTKAYYLRINGNAASLMSLTRASAFSIRCVKQ